MRAAAYHSLYSVFHCAFQPSGTSKGISYWGTLGAEKDRSIIPLAEVGLQAPEILPSYTGSVCRITEYLRSTF